MNLQLYRYFHGAAKPTVEVKGKVFLFTGFRDKDLKAFIEKQGGTVANYFSKQVNYVVTLTENLNTLKMQKAKKYGASIVSVRELLDVLEKLDG